MPIKLVDAHKSLAGLGKCFQDLSLAFVAGTFGEQRGKEEEAQMTVPHHSSCSSRKVSYVQPSFHLLTCSISNVSQRDQRKHLKWELLMRSTILKSAVREMSF